MSAMKTLKDKISDLIELDNDSVIAIFEVIDGLCGELQKLIDDLPPAKFRWESHESIGYKRALKKVLVLLGDKQK